MDPLFRRLWLGQLVSNLGTQCSLYSLGIWSLEAKGELIDFATVAVVVQLSKIIIAPLLTKILRFWPRGHVMLAAQFLGGLCTFFLAAQVLFLGSPQLMLLLPLQSVAAMAEAALILCFVSLIPILNPERMNQARANGLFACTDGLISCFAPFAGSWLLVSVGLMGVLLIDAATFLIAIWCLLRSWVPPITQALPLATLSSIGRPVRLRHLLRLQSLRPLSLLGGAMAWVYASTEILFPAWLIARAGSLYFELALILAALGYIIGFRVWQNWAWQWPDMALIVGLLVQSLILMGASLVLFEHLQIIWGGGVLLFCFSLPVTLAALQSRWQRADLKCVLPDLMSQRFRLQWIARLGAFASISILVDKLIKPALELSTWPNWLIRVLGDGAGRPAAVSLGIQGVILFVVLLTQWRAILKSAN